MTTLLLVHHSPTDSTRALVAALAAGAGDESIEGVDVDVRAAGDCTAAHLDAADGLLLFTPANFGYMAGMMKDLFDRTFLEIGGALSGDGSGAPAAGRKPFGLCVHGRYDTDGAVRSVLSIARALPWRQSAPVLSVVGDVADSWDDAYELGGTVAALLTV